MLSLFTILFFLQSQDARILFTANVVDFEKLANEASLKPVEECPASGNYVAGWEMSSKCADVSGIKEVFVSGDPVSSNHTIIPWEVAPDDFAGIIKSVFPDGNLKKSILIFSSLRLSKSTYKLEASLKNSGLNAKIEIHNNELNALKTIANLYRKKEILHFAILPMNDPGVITPLVLRELLQFQFRRGVPLIVRSRHEVFTGGLFAVEPVLTQNDLKTFPHNKGLGFKKYFNPRTASSLGLGSQIFEKLNFMAMTR